jgi:hypothetical protein
LQHSSVTRPHTSTRPVAAMSSMDVPMGPGPYGVRVKPSQGTVFTGAQPHGALSGPYGVRALTRLDPQHLADDGVESHIYAHIYKCIYMHIYIYIYTWQTMASMDVSRSISCASSPSAPSKMLILIRTASGKHLYTHRHVCVCRESTCRPPCHTSVGPARRMSLCEPCPLEAVGGPDAPQLRMRVCLQGFKTAALCAACARGSPTHA